MSNKKQPDSYNWQKFKEELWPQERDVIARPDRWKYIRKVAIPEGCVFCTAAEKGPSFESLVLWQNPQAMVVLNKYPYNNGHILVLPTRHHGTLEGLSDKEFFSVSWVVRASVRLLKETYECPGLNVGLNLGKVAGAGIPDHLHYHLIPRWAGDTNFFPLIAETKVVIETLEKSYERLKQPFAELDEPEF